MFLLPSKFAGSSKFWLEFCGTHGGDVHSTWISQYIDVASDVGVNLCNVKSCLNTSKNEIFTDKRGDLPCVNISKHICPVVK